MDEQYNPYAPPESMDSLGAFQAVDVSDRTANRSWRKSLAIWSLVCVLSAAPSFYWGLSTIAQQQALAMVAGIAIFVTLYTLGDQWTKHKLWRRDDAIRLALKIAYITRISISVILPVGGFLDLFCGMFSVAAVELLVGGEGVSLYSGPDSTGPQGTSFGLALLITLVQGVVLNVVVLGYGLVVWGLIVLIKRGKT